MAQSENQSPDPTSIRNIAIVAHVDHGKTTLVDAMLQQTGVFHTGARLKDRVLDSNDLERERGITILAKIASVRYEGVKIHIIDTPGHADFGGEVERTLRMADGALLLVDAAEGPLPQTRFVLKKAIALGMPIIVVINKIDRPDARSEETLNAVFDLFCELEASDEQADFATIYAIGKDGVAGYSPDALAEDLEPLFRTILERVPAPTDDPEGPFQMLVHDIQHDEYVGRLSIGRVRRGSVRKSMQIARLTEDGSIKNEKVAEVFAYEALGRTDAKEARAGELVCLAGLPDAQIGDTLTAPEAPEALPRIHVEEPTLKVTFQVNDSPFCGLSGKWVTSRHILDRLTRESKRNVAMRLEEGETPDSFIVYGRGELMIAVLLEEMRREGYEVAVGMPEVVTREVDGELKEPTERAVVDVEQEHVGTITSLLGERRGRMVKMNPSGQSRVRMEFLIPARGLLGFRSIFLTETRGTGLLNTLFEGWEPYSGPMMRRKRGAIVSDRKGKATPYALFHLQPRGTLFITPGTEVYPGMILGENSRENDLDVNVTKEKKLTNIRAAGRDENVILSAPRALTIEAALEFLDQDELLELTPDSIRLRKRILEQNRRPKRSLLTGTAR
jgi:GTP-binding protein